MLGKVNQKQERPLESETYTDRLKFYMQYLRLDKQHGLWRQN